MEITIRNLQFTICKIRNKIWSYCDRIGALALSFRKIACAWEIDKQNMLI